jgi:ribosomal 50S subunit-recycling heat shock protein
MTPFFRFPFSSPRLRVAASPRQFSLSLLRHMRLDIFLKLSRLEPRRTLAQKMCEAGSVTVNGLRAKSAHEVREADLVSIRRRGRITTVRVVRVPTKQPSKRDAESLYETVSVQTVEG